MNGLAVQPAAKQTCKVKIWGKDHKCCPEYLSESLPGFQLVAIRPQIKHGFHSCCLSWQSSRRCSLHCESVCCHKLLLHVHIHKYCLVMAQSKKHDCLFAMVCPLAAQYGSFSMCQKGCINTMIVYISVLVNLERFNALILIAHIGVRHSPLYYALLI